MPSSVWLTKRERMKMSAFWTSQNDITIGARWRPRRMICLISVRSKFVSKLPRSKNSPTIPAAAVPIRVPSIAPSTPDPVARNASSATRPSSGRDVSAIRYETGRRSSQSTMSAILNTSRVPASSPASATSPSSSGSPSSPSAIGTRKT